MLIAKQIWSAVGLRAEVSIDGLDQADGFDLALLENVKAYLRLDREACDAPEWLEIARLSTLSISGLTPIDG